MIWVTSLRCFLLSTRASLVQWHLLALEIQTDLSPHSGSAGNSQGDVVFQLQLRHRVILSRNKVYAELVFDGKDTVVGQVLALAVEDLGGEHLIAFVPDHQMDVSGSEGVSIHQLQQLAGGAVVWYLGTAVSVLTISD